VNHLNDFVGASVDHLNEFIKKKVINIDASLNRKKLDEINYTYQTMKRKLNKIAANKDECNIELVDK
jgi:hypothetical protein